MSKITSQDMEAKLLADGFTRSSAPAAAVSDPVVDTPMVLTLNQLRAYEHDPRVTRNPRYEDIKASIRERGLDFPPPVTRRPNEPYYIIRNGGNTRLAILNELWSETKEDQFFRLLCLFRPWAARGEIIALTGHLAENELRGGLSFIERSLGVEKARALYEAELDGKPLSQTELSRRLAADGYAVPQSHISRMREAVQYLLPAIPNVLYGGLGRHQIDRLATLRHAGDRVWTARSQGKRLVEDFPTLFQDVLSIFDGKLASFSLQRVQDELIGQMAKILGADYDVLTLEISDSENRDRALRSEPGEVETSKTFVVPNPSVSLAGVPATNTPTRSTRSTTPAISQADPAPHPEASPPAPSHEDAASEPSAHRIHSIQHLVSDVIGDGPEELHEAMPSADSPLDGDGLFPVTDIWHIDPTLDAPDRLRVHITQFAREIADEVGMANQVEPVDGGLGFVCLPHTHGTFLPPVAHAVTALLAALNSEPGATDPMSMTNTVQVGNVMRPVLQQLSDVSLRKLLRLLRLTRRLLELDTANDEPSEAP